MKPDHETARRGVLKMMLGAVCGATLARRAGAETPGSVAVARRYRAHAMVTVLGLTIFSRRDVGSGYATFEESPQPGGRLVALQFAGGSFPERARNLNRLGFIQELVTERGGEPVEAQYFGFITSSNEKNLDQAKQALERAGQLIPYSAARGRYEAGRFRASVMHVDFPSNYHFSDFEQIQKELKVVLKSPQDSVESQVACARPQTFLNSIRRAMASAETKQDAQIVYNGIEYRITTAKVAEREKYMRIDGVIRNAQTGHETPFKLWYQPGEVLPLKVEWRPKGFLRLTFEHDAAAKSPALAYCLPQGGVQTGL